MPRRAAQTSGTPQDIGVLVLSVLLAGGSHLYRVYQHGELISEHQELRAVAAQLNALTLGYVV